MIFLDRFTMPTFGLSGFATAVGLRARPATRERLCDDHELPRDDGPCSGGYNEAFIVQYWASYTPRE